MFFLSIISFFILAISGIQIIVGGYALEGIPILLASGAVPTITAFWRRRHHHHHHHGHHHHDDYGGGGGGCGNALVCGSCGFLSGEACGSCGDCADCGDIDDCGDIGDCGDVGNCGCDNN